MAIFEKGNLVRTRVTVQGMVAGNVYEVLDVNERCTPFGIFTSYRLGGASGWTGWVNNLHLLAELAV